MKINVTRRDVLRFAGGAAVGVALTPMPWSLTDDIAIWTQNWSWIPRTPRGETTMRATRCALCPAGCPINARCIGGQPVNLHAPAASEAGTLCSLGLTGHHLAYHPARVTTTVRLVGRGETRRAIATTARAAIDEVARIVNAKPANGAGIAVLDLRPGRGMTWAWRRMLAACPAGIVIPAPGRAGSSLATLASMSGRPASDLALDLTSARTIVSFGAPIAEGWGSPELLARLLARRESVGLIHVDPVMSATARLADRWLPARPGTEAILALGLANVLFSERLADSKHLASVGDASAYSVLVARLTPDVVAGVTGVPAYEIVETARRMASEVPTLVVAGEDPAGGRFDRATETAILALNVLLGGVGAQGGVVVRQPLPEPFDDDTLAPVRELSDIPDDSIAGLIIDASSGDAVFPWRAVERKLARGAAVIALSPYLGGSARHADFVIPTPAFLESHQECPAVFDSPVATYALSAPIVERQVGVMEPVELLRDLARCTTGEIDAEWKSAKELMQARVARIHESGRGSVRQVDGGETRVADLGSPDDLWKALAEGARWHDDASKLRPATEIRLLGDSAERLARIVDVSTADTLTSGRRSLTLIARAPRDATASAVISPVLSKLYRESTLRMSPGTVAIDPETARAIGVRAGRKATLATEAGTIRVMVATDGSVMPGVVVLVAGCNAAMPGDVRQVVVADPIDVCNADERAVWRSSAATLVEA